MSRHQHQRRCLLLGAAALAGCSAVTPQLPLGSAGALLQDAPDLVDAAPPAPREFRAAWVATVANIDWPSKPGLSAAQQIAEMRALLDRAQQLRLNAIVLQVRSSADALYESALEPWSEYLSGQQGQSPGYDPLALWISEAHQRGLELHAWFNPFRARPSAARSAAAPRHLSLSRPDWVRRYGDQLWIDPAEPEAAAHTLAVVADVLRRYDIDGVHIDDYFYPYPVPAPGAEAGKGPELDFPDDAPWQRYLLAGGTLARADWRRAQVDELVRRLHELIRRSKPWVRFGISPFGIGKPALRPAGIAGFSQYDKLYADVERWLAEGWLDYLAPQLYWPMAQKAQAFAPLLDYWHQQNPKGRHIWPGLFTSRINDKADSWPVAEIEAQIADVRSRYPGSGHLHFSMVALSQNRRGLADSLARQAYAEAALPPASPWLEAGGPAAPLLRGWMEGPQQLRLLLLAGAGKPVTRYALWLRRAGRWQFLSVSGPELLIENSDVVDALVVSAVDRVGNEGARHAYRLLP